jgi:hypothetical protein
MRGNDLVERVLIDYRGRRYELPFLLVGSIQGKLAHPGLASRLEEAIQGERQVVGLDPDEAEAFYVAARGISMPMERDSLEWHHLLAELQANRNRGNSSPSPLAARTSAL